MDGLQQNQQAAAAQEPPQTVLSSTYPPAPMEYVNLFTEENIKSGKAPQPPKIIKDNYTSFGRVIDPNDVLIRSLESQGIQRLYSTSTVASRGHQIDINEHKKELKKLNHSILIAYLDLLEILVKAPNTQIQIEQTQSPSVGATTSGTGSAAGVTDDANPQPVIIYKTLREQKLEDMELLFINMHHLINELRPHQARDNIRCILEMQKQQRVDTARKFKSHLYKIIDLLTKCIESVSEKMDESGSGEKLIDELNGFMTHAQHLGDELSKFDNTNKPHRLTNGQQDNKQIDQDMLEETTSSNVKFVNKKYANSRNCDANDLILCELIDEFLINENEF